MTKRKARLAALAVGAALCIPAGLALASSHREAPFIAKNPKVDGTDFYMFNSYESGRTGYVTLIANYQPVQEPGGGPNFFTLDPDALYEIHIDNNGDANEDITFQFQFQNALAGGTGAALQIGPSASPQTVAIPIINYGQISAGNNQKLNVNETYTVNVVRGGDRTNKPAAFNVDGSPNNTTFTKPVDYIGNTTFTNAAGYNAYASQYLYNVDVPGCTPPPGTTPRVFVGQRQEGFAVNLGTVFDLVGAPATLGTVIGGSTRAGRGDTVADTVASGANSLAGKNITSIALEIPASCLTSGSQTIIGGWTTASVRQARVINPTGSYAEPSREGGAWAQVSRLGMPLVNELIIGIKDKDLFNSSSPSGDGQFATYVNYPVLPDYLNLLFSAAAGMQISPTGAAFPRADLFEVFLTGIAAKDTGTGSTNGSTVNVNNNGATAEYLRLNTGLGFTARGSQNSLGALSCFVNGALVLSNNPTPAVPDTKCDPAGFPNGRRPGDDVVDIALRVAMGYLLPSGTDNMGGGVPFTDYAINYDTQFQAGFPYLNTPNPGHM